MDMTVEVPELPELTFDEASHIYRLNGDIIPSVSKLMEPLKDQCYGGISKRTLENAAIKGSAVHNSIENWIKFGIDDIPSEHRGYFNGFMEWWKQYKPRVFGSEVRIYHKLMRYGGTIDLLCEIGGLLELIDFKTTYTLLEMACGVQLEAYSQALISHGITPQRKHILHLKKDGKWAFREFPAKDPARCRVVGALKCLYDYEQSYLPAVNELYGSKEGRVAFFNELRERDGWNQPTSVSEAMKREEEVVTRLGSQPERWVASISKQLASHVKFYLQSEKNGGLTHPDYVGACVLNKLDECMKLSEAHQEYIQKEKEKIAAEEAEKRHREAEEINAKAKQEIEAAVKIIREGGRLNNDRIDYRVGDVGHNEPIVLFLMRRYKVGVPLRTQGWICSKLANVTIKDGRCDGLQYYKAKGAACSQRFFDCMNELVQKVIQEEAK